MRGFGIALGLALWVVASPTFGAPKKSKKPAKTAPAKPAPESETSAALSNALDSTLESDSRSATTTPSRAPEPVPGPRPEPAGIAPPEAERDKVVTNEPPAPEHPLALSLQVGMATLQQTFRSNGQVRPGRLDDYDYAAQGIAARIGFAHHFAIGPVLRLGLGGHYQYAGAGDMNTPAYEANGTKTTASLSLQSHQATAFGTVGAHASALGGVDLEAQVGPALFLNYIGIDARAPLPSDRSIGLRTGARIAAPALATAFDRSIGVSLTAAYFGLAAVHDQTPGLEDGTDASTSAFLGDAELTVGLLPRGAKTQFSMVLGYHAMLQDTTYSGSSVRNDATNGNASHGERSQENHAFMLGLALAN
jgi:hypothetical protein